MSLFFPLILRAQDIAWTPGLQQAYVDLSKLKVQTGRQRLATENQANGITIWLNDYADMITLLISDDEKAYNRLNNLQDQRLDQLRKFDENLPYKRVLEAEVRLHWGFTKLKLGHEVSAGWDILKAYRLLSENQKKFPNFLPTYKALGLLHILLDSVPENYTWMTTMLGLRGSIKQGLQELQQAQQDPIFRNEARLLELLTKSYILTLTPTEVQQLTQWVGSQPDNLLIHYFGAAMQMKHNHSEQALYYLTERPTGTDYIPMPILSSITGDIYIQQGEYDKAIGYYQRFLSSYTGQNFLKDAHYKLFLCYWLKNEDAKALPFLRKVPTIGKAVTEADKVAEKFAEAFAQNGGSGGQKILMKARLAFDGGFLKEAEEYLSAYNEASFPVVTEKAEFNYRLGRIQQGQNDLADAILLFERAIALSEPDQLSFGATSALQLGYIYQQKKDQAKARQFFRKALSYRKHEYKNSVDNKAKAALNKSEE